MTPLLHTIPSGGSGRGLSFYRNWAFCPRRGYFDQLAHEAGERSSGDSLATRTGTIYHALQQIYETTKTPGFDTTAVEFVQTSGDPLDIEEAARLEAERLFRAFRLRYKPKNLGRVVGAEILCESSALAVVPQWLPAGMTLTARLDKITNVSIGDVIRIRKERGLNLTPGYYLVDYKTDAFNRPNTEDKYRAEVQFMLYQLLWNALHPKQILKGALVDVIFKTKAAESKLIYCPPVGAREEAVVASQLSWLFNIYQTTQGDQDAIERQLPPCNPSACYPYNDACHWLVEGRCERC